MEALLPAVDKLNSELRRTIPRHVNFIRMKNAMVGPDKPAIPGQLFVDPCQQGIHIHVHVHVTCLAHHPAL